MTRKAPYLMDIGLGLLLTCLVTWSYHKKSSLLEVASLKTYDLFSKYKKTVPKTESLEIVEIDEDAVTTLGRWPWSRSMVAQLIDDTVGAGAQVIGLNILYNEADKNQGLEEINRLYTAFADIMKTQGPAMQRKRVNTEAFIAFLEEELQTSKNELDGDSTMAMSIEQAVNVVLPMYFRPGDVLGNNVEALPEFFSKEKLAFGASGLDMVPPGNAFSLPLEMFGKVALAVGHSNLETDIDGTVRRLAPVMRYGDSYFPSFGLQLAREYLKLQRNAVQWTGSEFKLMKLGLPVDENMEAFIQFGPADNAIHRTSAVDVLSGSVPENGFANKIVLIGVTATGLGQTFIVPGGRTMTGLEVWAYHLENMLNSRFIVRPKWAPKAEWGLIAFAALIVLLVLPFVRARFAIPITALVFVALPAVSGFLFFQQNMWISPTYAFGLLLTGFTVILGRRLIFTEKGKELVEAEGMETNKMLGLSFQGQGMLDLAFEKFRRCPLDDAMKDLLYNLGLDMERKRQFTKAAAVYEHISTVDEKFKDIKEKIELLKKAGEGAVFGGIGKKGSDATVVVEGLSQHTTLGRYEVLKELGRGAMGIVYLGKDPKINRQVAIKTLRFEDEVDEEQTKSIKERFFREAESAGNLTHPNIIRIFDAGEDQEVAYIAMELLDGEDLKKYCEKAALLPMTQVLDMVARVASGLDYAHKQGVVHRDIKPANIMLLKDGTLRITDFGIARIQATSKTATGAVLGTPAYMSPEQVNGKKVDGRADIFSLGVTLFEMLTGEKPFYADSIAALLYRIANVDHPDPREFNKNIPAELIPIFAKALAKDPEQRYQTAGDFGNDLTNVMNNLKNPNGSGPRSTEPVPPTPVTPTNGSSTTVSAPSASAPAQPKAEQTMNETKTAEFAPPASAPQQPISDKAFLNELEAAFNLMGAPADAPATNGTKTPVAETPKAPEKKPELKVELPETNNAIPTSTEIEKTVLIDPGATLVQEPPTVAGIDHGFQPPAPKAFEQDEEQRKAS